MLLIFCTPPVYWMVDFKIILKIEPKAKNKWSSRGKHFWHTEVTLEDSIEKLPGATAGINIGVAVLYMCSQSNIHFLSK